MVMRGSYHEVAGDIVVTPSPTGAYFASSPSRSIPALARTPGPLAVGLLRTASTNYSSTQACGFGQEAMRKMLYMCRYRLIACPRRVSTPSSSGSRWSNPMNSV